MNALFLGSLAETNFSIKASTASFESSTIVHVAILVQVLKSGSSCLCSRMMHQAFGGFCRFELYKLYFSLDSLQHKAAMTDTNVTLTLSCI